MGIFQLALSIQRTTWPYQTLELFGAESIWKKVAVKLSSKSSRNYSNGNNVSPLIQLKDTFSFFSFKQKMVCKFDKIEIESFSVIQLNVEKKIQEILAPPKKKKLFSPIFGWSPTRRFYWFFFHVLPPPPPPSPWGGAGLVPGLRRNRPTVLSSPFRLCSICSLAYLVENWVAGNPPPSLISPLRRRVGRPLILPLQECHPLAPAADR